VKHERPTKLDSCELQALVVGDTQGNKNSSLLWQNATH